jgi:hypothetical protein
MPSSEQTHACPFLHSVIMDAVGLPRSATPPHYKLVAGEFDGFAQSLPSALAPVWEGAAETPEDGHRPPATAAAPNRDTSLYYPSIGSVVTVAPETKPLDSETDPSAEPVQGEALPVSSLPQDLPSEGPSEAIEPTVIGIPGLSPRALVPGPHRQASSLFTDPNDLTGPASGFDQTETSSGGDRSLPPIDSRGPDQTLPGKSAIQFAVKDEVLGSSRAPSRQPSPDEAVASGPQEPAVRQASSQVSALEITSGLSKVRAFGSEVPSFTRASTPEATETSSAGDRSLSPIDSRGPDQPLAGKAALQFAVKDEVLGSSRAPSREPSPGEAVASGPEEPAVRQAYSQVSALEITSGLSKVRAFGSEVPSFTRASTPEATETSSAGDRSLPASDSRGPDQPLAGKAALQFAVKDEVLGSSRAPSREPSPGESVVSGPQEPAVRQTSSPVSALETTSGLSEAHASGSDIAFANRVATPEKTQTSPPENRSLPPSGSRRSGQSLPEQAAPQAAVKEEVLSSSRVFSRVPPLKAPGRPSTSSASGPAVASAHPADRGSASGHAMPLGQASQSQAFEVRPRTPTPLPRMTNALAQAVAPDRALAERIERLERTTRDLKDKLLAQTSAWNPPGGAALAQSAPSVVIVRQSPARSSGPAAYWERSYLGRLALRVRR